MGSMPSCIVRSSTLGWIKLWRKWVVWLPLPALACLCLSMVVANCKTESNVLFKSVIEGTLMSRSLIVLPDDSAKPIVEAINGAKDSIRVKMFLFSDPTLLGTVVAAQRRGVKVRIMLNPERRDGEKENDDSRKMLIDAGIEVLDSNPEFDLTHEKSMV